MYLGCKVTDGVRYAGQLSHMMSTLLSANICTSMVRAVLLCYKRGGGGKGVAAGYGLRVVKGAAGGCS